MSRGSAFFAALLVAAAVACSHEELSFGPPAPPLDANQIVSLDATVRYTPIEGGCWFLSTANGHYNPVTIPASFRDDGLGVHVVLRGAPGMFGVCGPTVALDSIRRRCGRTAA